MPSQRHTRVVADCSLMGALLTVSTLDRRVRSEAPGVNYQAQQRRMAVGGFDSQTGTRETLLHSSTLAYSQPSFKRRSTFSWREVEKSLSVRGNPGLSNLWPMQPGASAAMPPASQRISLIH